MSDIRDNIVPPAGAKVGPTSNLAVRECFAPFIPHVAEAQAPKPKPAAKFSGIQQVLRELGIGPSTDANPEAGVPAPEEATNDSETDLSTEHPDEILTASVETLPIPPNATAPEIFTWIKWSLLAQTHLPEDAAERGAFWAISTWFQEALTVHPCLVITGPAHDARNVLHVLRHFCRRPLPLLAGFRRSDLKALPAGRHTILVSEPNLDKRTAALLGDLTDSKFLVIEGGSLTHRCNSMAIYAGEDPVTYTIQNSIHIHLTPKHAEPPRRPEWLQKHIEYVPGHLEQYREKNLGHVSRCEFVPSGLSSGTWAIGETLGSCIVDAPELQKRVVALLKTPDQRRLFEMSDTIEAVVVEAIRNLSRGDRKHAYVREIAAEVNRLLQARGETVRLSPEKVGHRLKKLDLRTHPLSQTGNGLTFDKATIAVIQQLASAYGVEDMPEETENLHDSQAPENK